ncbi:succinate dehydrogenase cytochrome b558 subunit [Marinicrinis sediminis]|uniref:Succinate dehydrogenase cytochrome b558 subunit n=1 Tax=Marinicrinis sediminis TaxID=1652465 RepID=A0ABW5R7C6_9BACL
MKKLNSFYSRKLHSLLGVIPLGFFLVEHMLTNYEAFSGGKEAFIEQVLWLNSLPLVLILEIVGIWLPLLYHGVYGLYIAYQARNNVTQHSYARNIMFMLQRVTGVMTLVFVVWHFYDTRFQVALGNIGHEDLAARMHELVTNPLYFVLYCIGIVAAVFHFSNGMWSFLVSWGITVGPRAQRVSSYIWMGVFVILSTLFILALTSFTNEEFAVAMSMSQSISS